MEHCSVSPKPNPSATSSAHTHTYTHSTVLRNACNESVIISMVSRFKFDLFSTHLLSTLKIPINLWTLAPWFCNWTCNLEVDDHGCCCKFRAMHVVESVKVFVNFYLICVIIWRMSNIAMKYCCLFAEFWEINNREALCLSRVLFGWFLLNLFVNLQYFMIN